MNAATKAEIEAIRKEYDLREAAEKAERLTIKAYANHHGYSDVHPFEVVRVISAKCVEVREMGSWRDPMWSPEVIPGGFCGHCTNQEEQRHYIHSDPAGRVVRLRLTTKGWTSKSSGYFVMSHQPRKFHDYNF